VRRKRIGLELSETRTERPESGKLREEYEESEDTREVVDTWGVTW